MNPEQIEGAHQIGERTAKVLESKLVNVLGSVEVTVQFQDGRSETVKVQQVPFNKMLDYLRAQDDECQLIELVTGKPKEWPLSLTSEDFNRIVELGEKVNADFFGQWWNRRLARLERMLPRKQTSASNSGSPTSPSSAG
jgi:hypothetical protein